MKTKTTINIIIVISILIGAIFLFRFIDGLLTGNSDLERRYEFAASKISLLEKKNIVLEQDTIKLNISIDSLSGIIAGAKLDIYTERERRKSAEEDYQDELEKLSEGTHKEQVEYFIASTYDKYPVKMYQEFYLISLKSIQFSNSALVNVEYMENENDALLTEISQFERIISGYDNQISIMDRRNNKNIEMLTNKDAIIANLNIQIGLSNKYARRLRLTKNIYLGIGALGFGAAIFK